MKKKQLEILEKINEERKLNEETKEKIRKKVLKNFLFATVIILLFVVYKLVAINLEKQIASLIYKEISIGLFIITLFLFEVAYKKEDDNLAITSIEMFFLTIVTLLSPYILISRTSIFTALIGVYFVIYYSVKNLIIYRNEKNSYLNKKSDITEIVKKESKDKFAQEQLERNKQKTEKENVPKRRGRGRPKKTTSETTPNIEKTTKTTVKKNAKTTQKEQKTEEPKKRGRPRKVNNEE